MDGKKESHPPQTRSAFTDIHGAKIHYEITGAGEPLVLIHGFGLDLRMWDEQFTVLSRTHRVLRYDARGFGRSSVPAGMAYTHAEDLNVLLNLLDIQAATVIGLSMGGRIALHFALTFPTRIRALALVDSALDGYRWSDEWNTSWEKMARMSIQHGPKAANELWLAHPLFVPAREHPDVSQLLAQMVGDYSGWHWANTDPHRSLNEPDVERLRELHLPALVLLGERDLPDFHAIADILSGGIKNAQKIVIPGVGHMSNMEAPDRFVALLLSFLSAKTLDI
jgi:3-oxoadipate enol-lactonase